MARVSLSKYYRSFSGTDTIAFLVFPGCTPIAIGTLTTISYSMYRSKVPVLNIGRTNINGIARGHRIYAGSMVFTLINKHWLRQVQDAVPYLAPYPTLKTDELPLFDIMIISANEYGSSVVMSIYGIDFTDESQTISVEDLFTENVFKFVARDISVFDEQVVTKSETPIKHYFIKTVTAIRNFIESRVPKTTLLSTEKTVKPLERDLYYSISNEISGEDVAAVQQLLNLALDAHLDITYVFDRMTDAATRQFQAIKQLPVNGVVDQITYINLLQYVKDINHGNYGQVINKSGAYLYRYPDTSSTVVDVIPYLAQVKINDIVTDSAGIENYYETDNGYIAQYDLYNYQDNNSSFGYQTLKYNDRGPEVTILQKSLVRYYDNFTNYKPGVFDDNTEKFVRQFQKDNNLIINGIVDKVTWEYLLMDGNDEQYFNNNVRINIPKVLYHNSDKTLSPTMDLKKFDTTVSTKNDGQVKVSCIIHYKDNKDKTVSKLYKTNNKGTKISLNDFQEIFMDDIKNGSPLSVDYMIYPYGSIPYKWSFDIKE